MSGMPDYSSILYKADQRVGKTEEVYESYSTRISRNADMPHQDPLNIGYCEDVVLSGGAHANFTGGENILEIILPVTGAVSYTNAGGISENVPSEKVLFTQGSPYLLENPFQDRPVNFLKIGLHSPGRSSGSQVSDVGLREFNRLSSLKLDTFGAYAYACIGVYKGRAKGRYELRKPSSGVFVYIINGAFEVEERLMEHRDGLSLWNTGIADFESLSESGIILVIETPLKYN